MTTNGEVHQPILDPRPHEPEIFYAPEMERIILVMCKVEIPIVGVDRHAVKTVAEIERVLKLALGPDVKVERLE